MCAALACALVLGACSSTADDTNGGEVGAASPDRITEAADTSDCGWSQAGGGPLRFHATACADTITADNVGRMSEQWFFPTPMEVTGAPAVDEARLYFGDWSGRFYAVDRATGTQSWTYDIDPQPNVYAGQITASPALATIGDRDVVVFGGAHGVYRWIAPPVRRSGGTPSETRPIPTTAPSSRERQPWPVTSS